MSDQNYFLTVGALTFPITPRFFPRMALSWKRNGYEVSTVDSVPVHGWFSEADQDSVWADWAALNAMAKAGGFIPMVFRKQDGTILYTYDHATISDLKAVDFDGGMTNHIEFEFTIQQESGVTFPGLVDVQWEDEEIEDYDETQKTMVSKFRRRVLATGVKGDTSAARSFVDSLKPNLQNEKHGVIRTINFDGTVEGVWEFDNTSDKKGTGIKKWTERVTYMPGIRAHKFYRTQGIPVLVEGGFQESFLEVSGTIVRYDSAFPSGDELTDYFKSFIGAATQIVFADRPRIGAPYVSAWDAKDPLTPTEFTMEYSYTLAYGEANPKPSIPMRPRDDRNG